MKHFKAIKKKSDSSQISSTKYIIRDNVDPLISLWETYQRVIKGTVIKIGTYKKKIASAQIENLTSRVYDLGKIHKESITDQVYSQLEQLRTE